MLVAGSMICRIIGRQIDAPRLLDFHAIAAMALHYHAGHLMRIAASSHETYHQKIALPAAS